MICKSLRRVYAQSMTLHRFIATTCCLALCGCVWVDVPPSLPTVDVVDPDTGSCLCGDGICSITFHCVESYETCLSDCHCGDGVCGHGETNWDCPQDCWYVCGDGICSYGETAFNCPTDCGDQTCDAVNSETLEAEPGCGGNFVCGDGLCQIGEAHAACPEDCLFCGDGVCTNVESTYTCPLDCGWCGDGKCDATGGEDLNTCDDDCGPHDVVDSFSSDTSSGDGSAADTGPNCSASFPYALGCPCTADDQCYGYCVPAFWPGNIWGANGVCVENCTPSLNFNSCDPGFTCSLNGDYGPPFPVCLPQKAPCQPCHADSECMSGAKCLEFSGVAQAMNVPPQNFPDGKFCRAACATAADCIDADTPSPACVAGRCVPSATGCSCTVANAALGLSTDCTATVNGKSCPGTAACGFDPAYGPALLACEATSSACP